MNLLTAPLSAYQPVSRRGFFELLVFTALSYFVTRKTQAKLLAPKLEGQTIPRGLYISQVVGRGRPFYPQEPIRTAKLISVVEPLDLGCNQSLGPVGNVGPQGPVGPAYFPDTAFYNAQPFPYK